MAKSAMPKPKPKTTLGKWSVDLPGQYECIVEGVDPSTKEEAINRYNLHMGITQTDHEHIVHRLDDDENRIED